MSAIEQRARELLAELARNFGQPEYAYHIGCGGFLDAADRKVIAPIIAALTPPEGYVAAPEEPSLAMTAAGQLFGLTPNQACAVYQAMLAARPEVKP